MSKIAGLGTRLIRLQTKLGLPAPAYYNEGQKRDCLSFHAMFYGLSVSSTLHDLYAWKNGMNDTGSPMSNLWITPGFYLLSVEASERENLYARKAMEDWKEEWYSVLTNGGGCRYFVDRGKVVENEAPVFLYDPYRDPVFEQVYDGIERMLFTFVTCYEEGVYYVSGSGDLKTHFEREVKVSEAINPQSQYWRRKDLF